MTGNVLLEHGTVLSMLKPVNIVQAAERDMRLDNAKVMGVADDALPFAFDRRHVHRANNAAHLVALAFFEGLRRPTNKTSTLIVYRDRELLRLALIEMLQG